MPFAAAPGQERACFESVGWPAADRLFQGDAFWLGADSASSIPLGPGRTLWLFGDTWIDPLGRGSRRGAEMIRNSVAIQTGANPATADIRFFWKQSAAGRPGAIFDGDGSEWLWPGHGTRLGERLLVFANRLTSVPHGLGFESVGWTAFLVADADAAPDRWSFSRLATPPDDDRITPGFASVLRWQDHLLAFGSGLPVTTHPVYVARWPLERAANGDLGNPEWYRGEAAAWSPPGEPAGRQPLFDNGQSELTIVFDPVFERFIAVQTVGFGKASIGIRDAPAPEGPWSDVEIIFDPPENRADDILIYSAKAHPQLDGADLVLTYSTNTGDIGGHFRLPSVYYPRFVKLTRC